MLNKMSLKLAGLALGLMLVAGCQHQGAGQASDTNAKKPAAEAQRSTTSTEQAEQQLQEAEQVMITVHLAQLKAEPDLVTVELGGDDKLYALPRPVLTNGDIKEVTPVTTEDNRTFIMFDMTQQGSAKLADISQQAAGHFFLISVQGQLIGVSQISEPIKDGKLIVATENAEHSKQILELMR